MVIVDARHPLTPLDRQLLDWHAPSGQPVLVLLTKADKLGRAEAGEVAEGGAGRCCRGSIPAPPSQLFSAVAGTGQRARARRSSTAWLK